MSAELPALDRAQAAMDEGDWQAARAILASVDDSTLTPEDAPRAAALRAMLRPDPLAVGIAVALGLGLLAITVALYI